MSNFAIERDHRIAAAAKYEPGRGQIDIIHIQVILHDERLALSVKAEVVVSLHRSRSVNDLSQQVCKKLPRFTFCVLQLLVCATFADCRRMWRRRTLLR